MGRLGWAVVLVIAIGCGDDGGSLDAGPGTDGARVDGGGGADGGTDGGSGDAGPRLAPYQTCESTAQCPADHECNAPHAAMRPQCRHACTGDGDCPPSGMVARAICAMDGFCAIYCSDVGTIPTCALDSDVECVEVPGFLDGFCGDPL